MPTEKERPGMFARPGRGPVPTRSLHTVNNSIQVRRRLTKRNPRHHAEIPSIKSTKNLKKVEKPALCARQPIETRDTNPTAVGHSHATAPRQAQLFLLSRKEYEKTVLKGIRIARRSQHVIDGWIVDPWTNVSYLIPTDKSENLRKSGQQPVTVLLPDSTQRTRTEAGSLLEQRAMIVHELPVSRSPSKPAPPQEHWPTTSSDLPLRIFQDLERSQSADPVDLQPSSSEDNSVDVRRNSAHTHLDSPLVFPSYSSLRTPFPRSGFCTTRPEHQEVFFAFDEWSIVEKNGNEPSMPLNQALQHRGYLNNSNIDAITHFRSPDVPTTVATSTNRHHQLNTTGITTRTYSSPQRQGPLELENNIHPHILLMLEDETEQAYQAWLSVDTESDSPEAPDPNARPIIPISDVDQLNSCDTQSVSETSSISSDQSDINSSEVEVSSPHNDMNSLASSVRTYSLHIPGGWPVSEELYKRDR